MITYVAQCLKAFAILILLGAPIVFLNVFPVTRLTSVHAANGRVFNTHEVHKDAFTILTYSDRFTPGLCMSMATAALHGFELRVLGLNEASFSNFSGDPKMKKLLGMKELFRNHSLLGNFGLHDEGILIFADADDVIYLGDLLEVEEHFRAVSTKHGEDAVLVAAERNCWPYFHGQEELIPGGAAICNQYPSENSTFHYLNSGAYMGKLGAVKRLFDTARFRSTGDDQLVLQELYADQVRAEEKGAAQSLGFKVVLDSTAAVFQTGWGTHLESMVNFAKYDDSGAYFDTQSNRVINTEHDTRPFLVHFNGGGKAPLQPITTSILAQANAATNVDQVRSVFSRYRSKFSWFDEECVKLDAIGLLDKATLSYEAPV